jgi:ribonuclease E
MTTRMLIDATHPEETRVVIQKGNRVDEFDFETSTKKTLKGNIYLAKVTRVEPSLQAAFIEYGGTRHGFLAFGEIHPDYYQIPRADREALLAQQAAEAAAEEEEDEDEERDHEEHGDTDADTAEDGAAEDEAGDDDRTEAHEGDDDGNGADDAQDMAEPAAAAAPLDEENLGEPRQVVAADTGLEPAVLSQDPESTDEAAEGDAQETALPDNIEEAPAAEIEVAEIGGADDTVEETRKPRRRTSVRQYKIQEVIKRRQIMLVQVVKEERGNKGAALTTYLSLAGRYCVLMPNTARGGGVSRKIASAADRKRLKAITAQLECPEGMGVIVRTAGMERSKSDIKRDFEFLLKTWDQIRETTLGSTAPTLVYEEGTLIKRAIRDLYSKEIDEVLIEGNAGYDQARELMRLLMPAHAMRLKAYADPVPLFQRFQVENQLDGMYNPTVQLKSGGYIVINPTEALVAIDVNSGKATREHNIEETAYKTNLEAAEEVARQLRLRDLAGLIVIDFIDMENGRNARAVERRLKDCLKRDRARIQVGRISPFGLLEMSRQRLRPSLIEASTQTCPHCSGLGYVRSVESAALHILHVLDEEGVRDRTSELVVHMATEAAIYLLNHKREAVAAIEQRYDMKVVVAADPELVPPNHRIDRTRTRTPDPARLDALRQWRSPDPDPADVALAAEVGEDEDSAPFIPAEQVEVEDVAPQSHDGDEAEGSPRGEDAGRRRDGGRNRRRRRGRNGSGRGEERAESERPEGERVVGERAVGERADGERPAGGRDRRGSERRERPASPPTMTPANALDVYGYDPTEPVEPQDSIDEGQGDEEAIADANGHVATTDAEGERKRRRRGRRGGRRRRRDDQNGAPEGAEPADHLEGADGGVAASGENEPVADVVETAPAAAAAPSFAPPVEAPVPAPEPVTEAAPVAPPAPPPALAGEIVVSSQTADDVQAKPRFGGWWRRKT